VQRAHQPIRRELACLEKQSMTNSLRPVQGTEFHPWRGAGSKDMALTPVFKPGLGDPPRHTCPLALVLSPEGDNIAPSWAMYMAKKAYGIGRCDKGTPSRGRGTRLALVSNSLLDSLL
jgi:hypothetical protein